MPLSPDRIKTGYQQACGYAQRKNFFHHFTSNSPTKVLHIPMYNKNDRFWNSGKWGKRENEQKIKFLFKINQLFQNCKNPKTRQKVY